MIGLTVHPSTGSGRTVKPYTVSRLKWVARIKGFAEGFVVHGLIIRLPTKAGQFHLTAIEATDMIYNTIQSNSSSFIHTTDNT